MKTSVTNDYALFCATGVDLKQTHVQHTCLQTFASVIYRCRQITPGIGIGTRYRYQSRPKVSVSEVSVNCGISLTLSMATKFLKNYTDCRHTEKYKNLRFITVTLIMLKQCKKTSQFKTQCKSDISHASETAKITVFYPTLCKTPDAPLQNELLY